MQAQPGYHHNTARPKVNPRSLLAFAVLVLFLLLGAGIGYFAATASVKSATLQAVVRNDTGITQNVRITVNNVEMAILTIASGTSSETFLKVGWTSPENGMFEVRATPVTTGVSDTARVIVTNGLSYQLSLRVR